MLNKLPLTKIKIAIAKILFKIVSPFTGRNKIVKRNGICYDLDLSEGIDLSIFLFGNFQSHITKSKFLKIPEDAVIFDVGGNFGIMSLQFAKAAKNGKVIAFEPTFYAINKFEKNLELNRELKERITIINSFISDKTNEHPNIKAYSSWKVDGQKQSDIHPVHLGIAKPSNGVPSITLDDFCEKQHIEKIDFIKIDTDGHEFEVFNGARNAIGRYRPQIIFEVGKYVMTEKGIDFSFYLDYFKELNYKLIDTISNKELDQSNFNKLIPNLGTTDIIALPN